MFNIVLFGPPGAGKGTQSSNIIAKYNLTHLSTGDLLRAEIQAGTQLGLKAKELMDAGVLVPDEVVIGMIANKLEANKDAVGFIFDGFPRTIPQAEALDKLLEAHNTSIAGMVSLVVEENELIKRLIARGMTSGRPDDQNEDLIKKRVEEYLNKTAPVANYYQAQGKLYAINGIGEIDKIFEDICKVLDSLQ
jgi:adenylate kinase